MIGYASDIKNKTNPFLGTVDGFRDVIGAHYYERGSLTKWTGFNKEYENIELPPIPESGNPITGIFEANFSNGTKTIIAVGLTGIYRLLGGLWQTLATGRTAERTDLAKIMMLNDLVYIFNGKDTNIQTNGSVAYKLGVDAPTTAPVATEIAGPSMATGTYQFVVTFVNDNAGFGVQESNPSPAGTLTISGATGDASVTLPVSTDLQVTKRRIYRTTNNGAILRFATEIGDNTTTTVTVSVIDSTLGIEVDQFGNGVAPIFDSAYILNGVLYGASRGSSTVYFSGQNKPQAFHSSDFRVLDQNDGDAITGISSINSTLCAFKRSSIWNAFGINDPLTLGWVKTNSEIGSLNQTGIVIVPGQNYMMFISRRGIYSYDGVNSDKMSSDIDLFYITLSGGVLQQSVGAVYEDRNCIWWLVSTDISQKNNVVLIWDYDEKKWSRRLIPNTFANTMAKRVDLFHNEGILIGGYDGQIRNSSAGYSDDGTAIEASYLTRPFPQGIDTESDKVFYEITLFHKQDIDQADTVAVDLILNSEDAVPTTSLSFPKTGTQSTGRLNLIGKRLFARIRHSSLRSYVNRGIIVKSYDTGRIRAVSPSVLTPPVVPPGGGGGGV